MRAIGPTIGGPRAVVQALTEAVGAAGLLAMPGFSDDAKLPGGTDLAALSAEERARIEDAVLGFDPARSPTAEVGAIGETFRTWPGTLRSAHPAVSICLRGPDAQDYVAPHPLPFGTGPDSPMGRLRARPQMKILLIGVSWNRCTAFHTAESLAETKRRKTRYIKHEGAWVGAPDVANDMGRIFPAAGAAFEAQGSVSRGRLGAAECSLFGYGALVEFAQDWIDAENRRSGARS
jgi:aminoglycoside 3-N-acetyltransferase